MMTPQSGHSDRTHAITLRPFQPEDGPRLAVVFRAAVYGSAARDYTPEQVAAWACAIDISTFGERCVRRGKVTWIATLAPVLTGPVLTGSGLIDPVLTDPVLIDEGIAGFSDLEPEGHVDMLYVHPACQRRGVARALLRHIEALARAAGMPRLYTEASITAQPAFLALGWRTLAVQTVTVRGVSMTNHRMEKRLESDPA